MIGADARGRGFRAVFGTHDVSLIDAIQQHARATGVPGNAYEFALLYGIQRSVQQQLVRDGYRPARAHQLRRLLVPLVHAPPRRTPRQRLVRRQDDVREVVEGSGLRAQDSERMEQGDARCR